MTVASPIAPNFIAGPTGLDAYAPLSVVQLDGRFFSANGVDTNKRWDGGSNYRLMGSVAPTDFGALSLTGAPGTAIPDGVTARYFLVGYCPDADCETAPQGAGYVEIANASGIVKDVVIPWTPGSLAGDYTHRRIYRALDGTDDKHLVATVLDTAGTYTDVAPDATIALNTLYLDTFRSTLPPIFKGLGVVRNQMWGWQRGSARAFFAQPVDIGLIFRGADFVSDQFVTIGAADGFGDVVTVRERYGSAMWYKQRARYEMTGTNIGNWAFRKMDGDFGLLSERCIVDLGGRSLCLYEGGLYWDVPSADPFPFGARPGVESPMLPTWNRLNLGAADTFFALHLSAQRLVFFCVALDYEPIPNVAIVCEYEESGGVGRFIGIDTLVWSTCGGTLYDSQGSVHLVFGDDLRNLWEPDYSNSQGVFAGSTTAAVTASTATAIAAAAAAFGTSDLTGPVGCPLHRLDVNGLLVDANRVYSNSATALTTYLFPTTSGGSNETVAVGVIPFLALFPKFMLAKNAEAFDIDHVEVAHDSGGPTNLKVWTAANEESLAVKATLTLATAWHSYIGSDVGCRTWTIEFTHAEAGSTAVIRAMTIHYIERPGVLLP